MTGRETFGSRMAYILALTGSAVGLGNLWRFPYMMGEYGGAVFLIVYVIFAIFISIPIMLCESVIGRRARNGTFAAMEKLAPGTGWKWLGLLVVFSTFIIVSYYSVVGGWSMDYLARSIMTGFRDMTPERAAELSINVFSNVWEPILFHTLFIGISSLIVYLGVKKGIEKFSEFTMPLLFILMIFVMIFCLCLPGAWNGVEYLIKPDWSEVSPQMLASALGQSFFSMSLGMGAVLIYSSYSRKDENLTGTAGLTMVFDTVFALMSGFAIMAAVFAVGVNPGSGPTLVFETLPYIFSRISEMSPLLGHIVSVLFFISVVMAAITSEIALVEVCVGHFMERFHLSRGLSTFIIFLLSWVVGVLCSLSFGVLSGISVFGNNIFEFFNKLSSNFLMMLGALAFAVFVGWVMDRKIVKEELTNNGALKSGNRIFGPLYFIIKWVAPLVILVIFLTNLFL